MSTSLTAPSIATAGPTPPQPPSSASIHRLLYRGALSLPNSHLLLDGITFAACLDAGYNLLQNPLALALESMRGRPSLRFMGVVKLQDVWIDESGGIGMWVQCSLDLSRSTEAYFHSRDIHPYATITNIYFQNMFCLSLLPSSPLSTPTSDIGIKVALGDSGKLTPPDLIPTRYIGHIDGPDTTTMVIFARLPSINQPTTLQLTVARLIPHPPPQLRLPRPDDPTPRKPPLFLRSANSSRQSLKRVASTSASGFDITRAGAARGSGAGSGKKRQKLMASGSMVKFLGSGVRLGLEEEKVNGNFRVPEVPLGVHGSAQGKGVGKGKERQAAVVNDFADGDVFSDSGDHSSRAVVILEASELLGEAESSGILSAEGEIEKRNKNVRLSPPLLFPAHPTPQSLSRNQSPVASPPRTPQTPPHTRPPSPKRIPNSRSSSCGSIAESSTHWYVPSPAHIIRDILCPSSSLRLLLTSPAHS